MKRISCVLAALGWLLVPTVSLAQSDDKAARYAAGAVDAYRHGQFGEAEQYYTAAIKASPSHFESYLGRADFYEKTGKKDKALADFNKAVAVSSNNSVAILARANFLVRTKDYAKALQDVNRVLGSESDNLEANLLRASLYLNTGQNTQCIADCKRILASTRVAYAYVLRGLALEKLKQLDKAKTDLETAINLEPRNESNLMLRFEFYKRQNMDDAALEDLNRIISLYPDSLAKVKLFKERLRLYDKTKKDDPERVKLDLGRIVELDPHDFDDRYKYSLVAWRTDPQISLKYINEAIAMKPDNAKYYGLRGQINADLKNNKAAIEDCTKSLATDANDADVYAARAAAHLGLYKFDEAIADSEKAISLAPNTVAALYIEGQAYEGLSKPKEATTFYNRFIEIASKASNRTSEEGRRLEQARRKVEIMKERADSAASNSAGGDSTPAAEPADKHK